MDDPESPGDSPDDPDRVPTVTCSQCDRSWALDHELDELQAGNRALEQFALDHHRHTGHYPDDVTPWVVACRHCVQREQFLGEPPARRWAKTHARHTGHEVAFRPPESDPHRIGPD